jgi:hypothetical protein
VRSVTPVDHAVRAKTDVEGPSTVMDHPAPSSAVAPLWRTWQLGQKLT